MNGQYYLADADGQYSPDPGDYWYLSDAETFAGMALVKRSHPWRTVTGQTVYAERMLKYEPTMRDLRRLYKAVTP